MGEYIKYRNEQVKIGTLEQLYYVTYQKYKMALDRGLLTPTGSTMPEMYAQPDSGFRFRFPFPDEDHFPLGDIGNNDYDRRLPVIIDPKIDSFLSENFKAVPGEPFKIEITQQKLIHREPDGKLTLALVIRDPVTGESFRIEDDKFIGKLTREIMRNHVLNESDLEKKNFYQAVATRIAEGYRFDAPAKKVKHKTRPALKRFRRRGKGP